MQYFVNKEDALKIAVLIDFHLKYKTSQALLLFWEGNTGTSKYCPAVNFSEVYASEVSRTVGRISVSAGASCRQHVHTNPASLHHASVPHGLSKLQGLLKLQVPLPAGHRVPRHVIATIATPEYSQTIYCPDF